MTGSGVLEKDNPMKQSDRVPSRETFPVMQTAPRPWVRRVLRRLAHLAAVLALPAAAWAAPDVQGAPGIGKVCDGSPRADIVSSRLGVKLLAEASRDGDRTAIVGPLSVEAVLAMASYGAVAPVRRAVQGMFVENGDGVWRTDCRLAAALDAARRDAGVDFHTANGIFPAHGLDVFPAFRTAIEDRFQARVARLDFSDPQSTEAINAWVKKETAALIPRLLEQSLGPDTVLVLVNALYFKGQWARPFDPSLTTLRPFHPGSGSVVERPTMLADLSARYREDGDFQAVELPYGSGGFALTVVLPRPGMPSADALDKLEADPSWLGGAGFGELVGILLLPRVNLSYNGDVLPFLERITPGVSLRDSGAFSGIAAPAPRLSHVIHGASLTLDEEGTEAAAATAAIFSKSLEARFYMQVDRPFAVAVRRIESGDLLFAAWVDDPGRPEPDR